MEGQPKSRKSRPFALAQDSTLGRHQTGGTNSDNIRYLERQQVPPLTTFVQYGQGTSMCPREARGPGHCIRIYTRITCHQRRLVAAGEGGYCTLVVSGGRGGVGEAELGGGCCCCGGGGPV